MNVRTARTVTPDVASAAKCNAPDKSVFATDSGCNWTLTGAETKGATGGVNVVAEGLSVTVPVRTWYPQTVSLKVRDATLSPIKGWLTSCTGTQEHLQRTSILAEATFKSAGVAHVGRVDHLVSLASTNEAVATVSGGVVSGKKAGQTEIRALVGTKELAKVTVTVDDKPVTVADIAVVVANKLDASVEPSPASAMVTTSPAKAVGVLKQQLFAEFATADVLTWAKFSDGERMFVTLPDGMTITSLKSEVVEPVLGKLKLRAMGSGKGNYVQAEWRVCDKVMSKGIGAVLVKLPPPKSAAATVSEPRIAISTDDVAAHAGVATDAAASVTLKYDDGSTKNVTLDKRTQWDDATLDPNDLFTVKLTKNAKGDVQSVRVVPTGKAAGKATLRITFTHAPTVVASVEVNVVKHDKFTLDAHPLPTYAGSESVSKTTLKKLGKTTTWQRARLDLDTVLSDGHTIDLSTHQKTGFAAYATGTTKVTGAVFSFQNQRDVSVVAAGKADVRATFAGVLTPALPMSAVDEPVLVKSLKTTFPATFSGIQNKGAAQMKVSATFVDGTTVADALSITGLLSFSSSHPKVASIHATTGLAMLHDNHRTQVTMTAKAVASGVTGATKTHCNLTADIGDVDLGRTTGFAHPDVKPGQVFTMPIRVNTGLQSIGALDLTVTYDKDVIGAVSGTAGKHWPGGQFEVTVNDPPGKVHIVAAAKVGTNTKGAALEVGLLTFKGVKTGAKTVTMVGGHITKLLDNAKPQKPIGAELKPGETRAIVAGRGELDPECQNGAKPADFRGNANGNCEFEVGDVSYTLQYLAQLIADNELEPFQKLELDADRNGVVEVRDAVYLLRVLAGKFRFSQVTIDSPGNLAGTLTVSAKLTDKAGNPSLAQNEVFFEIGFGLNDAVKWTTGKQVAASKATKHGVVVQAAHTGGGVYVAKATGFTKEEKDIGLVIAVKTQDASGSTSSDRQVALHGSPWLSDLAKFTALESFDMPRQICKAAFECDDKDLCTVEICNPTTEKCSYKPADCDDANACTLDSCTAEKGCAYKVVSNTSQPCYTGPKATKDIGSCKGGTVTCNADGTAGPCKGEIKPVYKEQCDAKDDDCDGTTDEGCAPTAFDGGFGSGVLEGAAGARKATGALAASWTIGSLKGAKFSAEIGMYDWLAGYFAKQP